jgi:acetyltransferase
MLDVGWGDLIDWLGRDPATESIVIYMESVGDARAFLAAAQAVAWRKPIIVIKVGRTEAAARAAASHTGAMTGSDAVLDAAFRRVGVLRVATISEVFDMAEVLAKQPRPAGPRLAIVTNAGGPGALATDALVCNGGEPAVLTTPTFEQLNRLLPDHWSHGNPVDILGDATPERFAEAARIVSDDPDADGTLVILTPQAMTDASATAAALARIQPSMTKPLLASWMGGPAVEDARRLLNQAGIPTYDYPDSAARTFALMWEHGESLRALGEPVPPPPWTMESNPDVPEAVKIVNSPRGAGAHFLSKPECNRILSAHRIPTLESHLATTEEAAVEWAARLGGAVVLKLHSATITHKTDAGGVKLDLVGEAAVRRAWSEIRSAVSPADFLGVTVEPMIPADGGLELIVGSSTDPQFGPVLLFGAGGQLVEVFRDRALGLPPLTRLLARQLIGRTRIAVALAGVRGRAPVDTDALEDLLVRFSHLVLEHPRIREIEINPLRASSTGLIALDVRIVLHGSGIPDDALPRAVLGDPPPAAARALS